MLGKPRQIGDRCDAGPASVWFNGRLWIGFRGTTGTLVVQSVDARGDGGSGLRTDTGQSIGWSVALSAWNRRLWVVYSDPTGAYWLTSSPDGTTFGAPLPLPIAAGFVETNGFAAFNKGLAIVWGENAGGAAHLLVTGNGATFTDTMLGFEIASSPGVCVDPDSGRLLLVYGERVANGQLIVRTIDPNAPGASGQSLAVDAPGDVRDAAVCTAKVHNRPVVHFAALPAQPSTSSRGVRAHTASRDLSMVGGAEESLFNAWGLSLASDGRLAWVTWRSQDDEIWVAPYGSAFDLPEEMRNRIGDECDPNACPADSRLVCGATNEVRWVWTPPLVRNAKRGDLLMTPGDGGGLIGSMLEHLEPRQYYDHMGIMLRNYDLVRHATMAHERMTRRDPGHYMTGTFFGDPAPVNGFRRDVLTYGWPGTITQSIEDAFFTGANTIDPTTTRPYNAQGDYFALNPSATRLPLPAANATNDEWHAWWQQQWFADPEHPNDKTYSIHNFPVGPAYRINEKQLIDALVIKPSRENEAADSRIRQTLWRIADAASKLHGHYRFYGYTDARIALDPAKVGPGGFWAAGTRPVVCSSFVWAAIQLANIEQYPIIEVEGRTTESPDEFLPTPFVDGLYRYLEQERQNAGSALHKLVADRVRRDVYELLQQAVHEKQIVTDLTKIGLTGLLTVLAGPVGVAVSLLGLTPQNLMDLKLAFEDMPDDVATQLCNTLAKDRADETDDDLWKSPGDGITVSPDDIKSSWDRPDLSSSLRQWHGLYGTSEKMLLTYGRKEPCRVHRLERSKGPAYVTGTVRYLGTPIVGAEVRFGCDTTMSTPLDETRVPMYWIEVSSGRYEATATVYWPATKEMFEGKVLVDVRPGDQPGPVDIELEPPPDWRRLVQITGKIDTVRKVIIGTDDWSHTSMNQQGPLTLAPNTWGTPPTDASTMVWKPVFIGGYAQRFNVRVDLTVTLQPDLSIVVESRSALCEHYYKTNRPPNGNQVVTSNQSASVIIPRDGSYMFTFDHVSGNLPPDRGHVEFLVVNGRSPA